MGHIYPNLVDLYPQLDTVEKMRGQGERPLKKQIRESLRQAKSEAFERGRLKGKSKSELNRYVRHKFEKHGLGDPFTIGGAKKRKIRDTSGGGFATFKVKRAKNLEQAREYSQTMEPFEIRPGGSGFGVYEGGTTHFKSKEQTGWMQHVAKPSTQLSTKYENLAPDTTIKDITRANKALVSGSMGDKDYYIEGGMMASLIRVNESSTAFGTQSMGGRKDVGTAIMAEVLGQKWRYKSKGITDVSMDRILPNLVRSYPQLDTVEKMRRQGTAPLKKQIRDSLRRAERYARKRGQDLGIKRGRKLDVYVKSKFKKHGLGTPLTPLGGIRKKCSR